MGANDRLRIAVLGVNQRGVTVLYRGILLPYSSNDETIDFIYGVINWKEMADQLTADELLLEIDQALDLGADLELAESLKTHPVDGRHGAGKVEDEGYIFCRRQEGQQVVRLKDEANLVQPQTTQIAAQPFAVKDRITIQHHPTRGWVKDAADDVQKRRLARP